MVMLFLYFRRYDTENTSPAPFLHTKVYRNPVIGVFLPIDEKTMVSYAFLGCHGLFCVVGQAMQRIFTSVVTIPDLKNERILQK